MKDLTNWLFSMISPLVIKVLAALGVSIFTVTGIDFSYQHVMNLVNQSKSELMPEVLQLMGLFGVDKAMSWILGGISFVFTYWTGSKAFSFFAIDGSKGG
ncbi:MAG: DUF2523 domain-containing protein [Brachymonas sp.]|nr:DUF2523 domain-containing protein [Brachymonas sp.]